MEILFDWFSFTVQSYEGKKVTPESVIADILEMDILDFKLMKGHYLYRQSLRYNDINVYFDGTEEMGIHIQISGQGCRHFENRKNFIWKDFIWTLLSWFNASISRVDIAIDTFDDSINLDRIQRKLELEEYTMLWKTWKPDDGARGKGILPIGKTIYFGTRESDVMLRMYDKKAKEKSDKDYWIRTELVIKSDKAENFCKMYIAEINPRDIGQIATGILNKYISFKEYNDIDTNISRWQVSPFWSEFLNTTEKLSVSTKIPKKKLEDVKDWYESQMSKTSAMLMLAYGSNYLTNLATSKMSMLSKKHNEMLAEFLTDSRADKQKREKNKTYEKMTKYGVMSALAIEKTIVKEQKIQVITGLLNKILNQKIDEEQTMKNWSKYVGNCRKKIL